MHLKNLAIAVLLLGLAACSRGGQPVIITPTLRASEASEASQTTLPAELPQATATALATPTPARLLTICLIHEPRSLFLYDAVSTSEQNVLAAIYDGPFDIKDFSVKPVILAKLPSLSDEDATLQPVEVRRGDLVVDAQGNLTNLGDGVSYRPSGCSEQACAQTYSGADPVQMDQLVVRFKLLPGLQWSDGNPLRASDSVYSYEVARALYPSAVPERVNRTASYKALDDLTVEWAGVPGFADGQYQTKFFSPLPQHAWTDVPTAELKSSEISSRMPIGWGAYVIDEWVAGDHISLHANPLYFRTSEGLPHFNNLVYRFVSDVNEAQAAVQAGECDLVDQAAVTEAQVASLLKLRDTGSVLLTFQNSYAWEVLEFDVNPLAADRPAYFASREVRQAVAQCINRQALAEYFSSRQGQVADSYVPATHPLYNQDVKSAAYDPQAASAQLTASGWLDSDNDPSTPRIAQGVEKVPDGTPFSVQYLVSDDPDSQAAAQLIQADLEQCGIQAQVLASPVEDYLAGGPDGAVFGRQFDMAQFAWVASIEPPCTLFLSSEIPGAYPEAPKGWGGMNASGYSNPAYDQACLDALYSLPDAPQHASMHAQAQAIFAEDVPALPLYWHSRLVIARADLCLPRSAADSTFSDLESFDYGKSCP